MILTSSNPSDLLQVLGVFRKSLDDAGLPNVNLDAEPWRSVVLNHLRLWKDMEAMYDLMLLER